MCGESLKGKIAKNQNGKKYEVVSEYVDYPTWTSPGVIKVRERKGRATVGPTRTMRYDRFTF
jgi:hypothetical protein